MINRVTTFNSNTNLMASDLNAEFNNILNEVNRVQGENGNVKYGTSNTEITKGYFEQNSYNVGTYGDTHKFQQFFDSNTRTLNLNARKKDDNVKSTLVFDVYGVIKANGVTLTSLREKKKDIVPFEKSALDIIESAQVREFKYLDETSEDNTHIGLIVDESPQEVVSNDGQGVDSYDMVSISWKAIQEMNATIKALQVKVAELESK